VAVIRLYPSGREIPCPEGSTVLAALEAEGWALPNNCRAGTCGECKVRVRSGEFDQGFVLDMALSPAERAEGYGVMCMAKPLSEVLEIEWGTVDARPVLFPPRLGVPFTLVDRLQRTPAIVELIVRPEEEPLRYWPGQYVHLGNPPEIPRRAYSIANAPRPDGELHFFVTKERLGRTSGWLTELEPGASMTIDGPYGAFIGDPGIETPVLCLAAGSGLAPILALTDAALRRGFSHPVTLVLSARTEQDVYPRGLLAHYERRYPNFRFLRTLTREEGPPPRGRIPAILPELAASLDGVSVFIAGPEAFVEDVRAACLRLGADPSSLYREPYVPQDDLGSLSILGPW
jgi:CDP-4-dehydro-6-deoxyglucose reductase